MDPLLLVGIVLVLAWSAYSVMRSRKKSLQKAEAFYSELIPDLEHYELSKSTTQYPVLSGTYQGYSVKLVPEVDNLVFQRLPRLYLRIYIKFPNKVLLRLRSLDLETHSHHLFLPNSFETSNTDIILNNQDYRLFVGEGPYPDTLEASLAKFLPSSDRCAEILFQANFIRCTILLAKGKQSAYIMTRSVDFSDMIFRKEFFQSYFQAILNLHKELNRVEQDNPLT